MKKGIIIYYMKMVDGYYREYYRCFSDHFKNHYGNKIWYQLEGIKNYDNKVIEIGLVNETDFYRFQSVNLALAEAENERNENKYLETIIQQYHSNLTK